MRLTHWTDYTLRVLMYCAASEGRPQPVTITEVAQGYGISRPLPAEAVEPWLRNFKPDPRWQEPLADAASRDAGKLG